MPEDWVGAYKKANEEISWRNGKKVIIHLADAGAHGKEFTPYDKYKDEGEKLMYELDRCFENKIKIFGYILAEDARNSFNECQKIYRKKGGEYEICDFILNNIKYYGERYTSKKLKEGKRIDYCLYEEMDEEGIASFDEFNYGVKGLERKGKIARILSTRKAKRAHNLSYQDRLNKEFKSRVINCVKSAIKKKINLNKLTLLKNNY